MLNDDHTGSVLEFVDSDAKISEATTFVPTAGLINIGKLVSYLKKPKTTNHCSLSILT